ncbi:MAG: DNA-binding transcriptional repressor PuuR [Syntrophorhabdaceae bacterium PtaU1.Bin034]|jgi:transcriptional regulator with XRE-family HTH domain|nr:MAG: DNA-binding transcriptional repressor PuuR [Syntrophorhabdaceae bacterium PtaU1.Bin034]
MRNLGLKIRNERKGLGLSLKDLASKVGISTMTLQRIETGKTSPSVSVLAQIACCLKRRIDYFLPENQPPKIVLVNKQKQSVVESSGMKLTIIASPELTGKNIFVNLGEAKKGRFIDPHTEEGHSLVYVLEGDAILEHDGIEHQLREGDAVYYDARYSHSVKAASEIHRFLSIFFKEDTEK